MLLKLYLISIAVAFLVLAISAQSIKDKLRRNGIEPVAIHRGISEIIIALLPLFIPLMSVLVGFVVLFNQEELYELEEMRQMDYIRKNKLNNQEN
jgi:hypothetical protein